MSLTITARFVAAVATAAIAPLMIYGLVSIYSLRTGNESLVINGNLNVATQVARQIDQYMNSNVEILQSVAAELRNTDLEPWQRERILKNYVLDFAKFRELTLFGVDGEVVATSQFGETSLSVSPIDGPNRPTIAPITVDEDLLPTTTVTIPVSHLGRREGWRDVSADDQTGVLINQAGAR